MFDVDRLGGAEKAIYEAACDALKKKTTAVEFSRQFFGRKGRLRELWRTKSEREALVKTDLYKWLQDQLAQLRRRDAAEFDGEIESLSGRLTVVVAKSLHGALRNEAVREGVSLSELIRLKLALPYRQAVAVLAAGEQRHHPGR